MHISIEVLKTLLSYDPDTGQFTWKVRRSRTEAGSIAATKATNGYLLVMINKKYLSLHRIAFLYMGYESPPDCVDHINGDITDNRWANLRPATATENARNQKLHSTNSSGLPGVAWDRRGRWRAYGGQHSRYIYLGRFDSLLDAAAARKSFERRNGYHANHGRSAIPVVNAHDLVSMEIA
ncbi:HNH endonuclease [Pseudomonas siliginis]|uniref:HNH endonuclease n=1 Tax=Pseudomonas siliginis TaxID=2842346 RepID=UPI0020928CCC|nr:HNH endonuclease [Pseudomonas siliginis]USU01727.1 HNH endonuclease [Pseudomonas siliginis]